MSLSDPFVTSVSFVWDNIVWPVRVPGTCFSEVEDANGVMNHWKWADGEDTSASLPSLPASLLCVCVCVFFSSLFVVCFPLSRPFSCVCFSSLIFWCVSSSLRFWCVFHFLCVFPPPPSPLSLILKWTRGSMAAVFSQLSVSGSTTYLATARP